MTLDRAANTALLASLTRGARVISHGDSMLALDGAVARLSDPCTPDPAWLDHLGDIHMLRGPRGAVDALGARLGWRRIAETYEMVWRGAVAPWIDGALQPAEHDYAAWRASFVLEAFTAGGGPPPVARDQLFVWIAGGAARAMAGLLPLSNDTSRIVTVYTPPLARGRGFAGALVAALAAHADVPWVSLDVSVDNLPGLRAYEHAGFARVGHTATWLRA